MFDTTNSTTKRFPCAAATAAAVLAALSPALSQPVNRQPANSNLQPSTFNVQPTEILVKTVDCDAVAGRLLSFSLERGLTLQPAGAAGRYHIAAEDIVRITPVGAPPFPSVGDRGCPTLSKAGALNSVRPSPTPGRGGAPIAASESGVRLGREHDRAPAARPPPLSPPLERAGDAPSAGMATVKLSNGDCLIGTAVRFADDQVTLDVPSIGLVRVPLERIAAWLTPQTNAKVWHSTVESMLAEPSAGTDRLLLTNGDQVAGVVTAIDATAFTLETSLGSSTIHHDRVVVAAIVSVPSASEPGLRAHLQLADGSRLTTGSLSWTDSSVTVAIFDTVEQRISARRIVGLDVTGGRWRWLADLTPISAEQTPMISVRWPHFRDRNILGGPLRVGGQSFEHGLGVHSRSLLTFDLGGQYSEFVTSYGIDDDSGPLADVTVNVRVDGHTRHRRPAVRRGTLWGPLHIDVTGANRIELIVDFGKSGSIQDRVDWIEPALVR